MPPIDPERLLRTLSPLLELGTGSIKSANEVDKLYGLMSKFSKKLVSKSTYINILKATAVDVLDMFMQRGGWDMICSWATDAMTTKNWAILKEMAELLLMTPVTSTRLRDNELPKIVKTLSKECENEATRLAASQVYEKWKVIAQQKEAPTYIGADGRVLSLEDNLTAYELPASAVSVVPDNQIILEADPTSGTFDLTQYIDAADLNNLETDFNPDDFNSTLDEHLMDGTEMVDGELVLQDGNNSVIRLPSHLAETQETLSQLMTPVHLQSTDPTKAPLCLVVRDGKRFLLRLQVGNPESLPIQTPTVSSAEEESTVGIPERKPKSPGKPKMPPSGKPKMPSSGKPPLKAYEAKAKKVNTEDSSAKFKGIPNFYSKEKGKDKEDKGKDRERKVRDKEADKKKSMLMASRVAAEAKRRVEEEKAEKLRLKVLEQKKVRDQRKEELAKKQKEIDEETLKSLKLTALPPIKSQPFAKIPKRAPSFADMIAIPGANSSKEKEAKKVSPAVSKSSKDATTSGTNQKEVSKITSDEPAAGGARKSRPKVFMSGKSRSLGLLEEMEQSQVKSKDKEKEKESKEVDIELPPLGSKKKRISTENLENPAASKKAKKEPPPKKVVGIQESSLFMDALNSVTTMRNTRSSSKRRSSDAKEPQTPTTPPAKSLGGQDEVKSVVFNFYRDTLGDSTEEKNGEETGEQNEKMSNGSDEKEEDNDAFDDIRPDSFVPAEGEGLLKSALVIHRPRNKPKKTVRWVEEADLKKFHYFDMDDTERVNVTRLTKNFTEMKQIERSEERKVLKRNLRKDNMEEKIPWVCPKKIAFKIPPHETGQYSNEVAVQNERESGILEVFYFSKTQIPDSPNEPDEPTLKNQDDPSILKFIPFEDIAGVTAVTDFVFKPRETEAMTNVAGRGIMNFPPPTTQFPGATVEPPKIVAPNDYLANYLQQQQQQQQAQQQQMPGIDMSQIQAQAQYNNLWNTLSQVQVPNAAAVAAVAAAGIPPGSDIWNQMQLAAAAAGMQQAAAAQGLAALNSGVPNFQLNFPYGFPPGGGGYSTNPGMVPPPANNQPPADQFGGPPNSNRFTGPPPNRGGGGMPPRRENRGGRPNRWDDRGNYDNDRRRDDFRRGGGSDGDHSRNNNDRDRDRGRGMRGDRGGGGNREREFQRTERNRAGTPRTVLCKFFQQGCCKVGEECDFLHPGINGPSRPSRFTSRFSSPPPLSGDDDQQSRPVGRVESPLKVIGDDDNWDAPVKGAKEEPRGAKAESFEHPPSSPNGSPPNSIPRSSEAPRMIPINESEPMES